MSRNMQTPKQTHMQMQMHKQSPDAHAEQTYVMQKRKHDGQTNAHTCTKTDMATNAQADKIKHTQKERKVEMVR